MSHYLRASALAALLFAFTFSISVPVSHAATSAEIAAQIAALKAQLTALSGGTSAGSTIATFTRDLTIGSTGADVTGLQTFLIQRGFAISSGASGTFGLDTSIALMSYQLANNITPANGYFGPVTRAKVNTQLASTPGPVAALTIDEADDDVNDPRLIAVDISDETEDVDVLSFSMAASDAGDVEVESIPVAFLLTGGATLLKNVVSAVRLIADGEEIGSWNVVGSSNTVVFTNLDFLIGAGDEVEFTVSADFRPSTGPGMLEVRFGEAQTDMPTFEAENEDGYELTDDEVSGSASSGPHTLGGSGLLIDVQDSDVTLSDDGKTGILEIEYSLTAIGGDVFIPRTASDSGMPGILYSIRKPAGSNAYAGTKYATLQSNAASDSSNFIIGEAETEDFTLVVYLTPDKSGVYGIVGEAIYFRTSPTGALSRYTPQEDLETENLQIGSTASTGTYRVYVDGKLTVEKQEQLKHAQLDCQIAILQVKTQTPEKSIRCTWNGEVIGDYVGTKPGIGTYIGFMNGKQFIRTENIKEPAALENCKLNHKNNPTASVRCTWNTKEIYNQGPIAGAPPTCAISVAPASVMEGQKFLVKWVSTNAVSAHMNSGEGAVAVKGSKSIGIAVNGKPLPLTHTFVVTVTGADKQTASCSRTVTITKLTGAKAAFNAASLKSISATPTVSGTATLLDAVYVAGTKIDGSGAFASETTQVKDGKWSVKLPKLANGSYNVSVVGTGYTSFAQGVLVVNAATTTSMVTGSTSAKAPSSSLLSLIAGVGAVFAEIPHNLFAIFSQS